MSLAGAFSFSLISQHLISLLLHTNIVCELRSGWKAHVVIDIIAWLLHAHVELICMLVSLPRP